MSKTYPNSRLSSAFKPQICTFSSASSQQKHKPGHIDRKFNGPRGTKQIFGARELQNITDLEDDWVALVAIQPINRSVTKLPVLPAPAPVSGHCPIQ